MSCNNCCPPVIFGTPGPPAEVCVSAEPDNTTQLDPDGFLYVPPSEPQAIATGCGILGDGTEGAPLAAGTAPAWRIRGFGLYAWGLAI